MADDELYVELFIENEKLQKRVAELEANNAGLLKANLRLRDQVMSLQLKISRVYDALDTHAARKALE